MSFLSLAFLAFLAITVPACLLCARRSRRAVTSYDTCAPGQKQQENLARMGRKPRAASSDRKGQGARGRGPRGRTPDIPGPAVA